MHLLDQRTLGIIILLLLGLLVTTKHVATGSVVDKPRGDLIVRLVNTFNLLFLIVVTPTCAIALLTRHITAIDPAPLAIEDPLLLVVLEIVGLLMYVTGCLLMAAALMTLGRNYQLGGSAPRSHDRLVTAGPYRLARHPMYTAALSIAWGLACLIQSWALLLVACIYLLLIVLLIPVEERGLGKAYGARYAAYREDSKRLIPFVY